jgi:hypothetical protein
MADASRPERPGSTTHASHTPWRRGSWPDHRTGRGLLGGCASLLATPDPGLNVDAVRLRSVVSSRPGSVLCFVLAIDDMAPSFARGHAEQRCSGACPQQARSSSAPYPLEGPVRGLCPGPGSGKRRARQLRRSTRLRAGSSSRGQVTAQILSRQKVELSSRSCSACCCLSRPGLLPLGVTG